MTRFFNTAGPMRPADTLLHPPRFRAWISTRSCC